MDWLKHLATYGWSLIEHAGLVGIAGIAFHFVIYFKDTRERRVEHAIKFAEQHQKMIGDLLGNKDTARIFDEKADATAITKQELHAVNSILLHLNSTLKAAKIGLYKLPEGVEADVREFLSLPIPQAAWRTLRASYDKSLVLYVERILSGARG